MSILYNSLHANCHIGAEYSKHVNSGLSLHVLVLCGAAEKHESQVNAPERGSNFCRVKFFRQYCISLPFEQRVLGRCAVWRGSNFFSVLGYGTILHGVKFFRALSFFTSTEFPGVVFPQYISRGAQLRDKFLKNCTTRNAKFHTVFPTVGRRPSRNVLMVL